MEQRLKVLDRYGIDLQVLTLSFPMVGGLEPEEEVRLARLANDGLAEIVQRYPHRFLGVATLPFSSPAEALREFDRCVDSWGFKGLQISSNVSGVLERLPNLKIIVHHLGAGMIPYFIERLDGMLAAGQGELPITRPPSYYWKAMYHDTAAVDANAFACGFNVFGAEHVVFGTDYPYGRNKGEYFLETRRRFVDEAKLDHAARQKIYEDNARQLLQLG
jgi:predicted TIM-barrel fold metal-dependent hydrolase